MLSAIEHIKSLLVECRAEEAVTLCDSALAQTGVSRERAELFYLRGNAYRQLGNMRMAQNSYLESRELDPDGAGAQAFNVIQEILNFYDKNLYNP